MRFLWLAAMRGESSNFTKSEIHQCWIFGPHGFCSSCLALSDLFIVGVLISGLIFQKASRVGHFVNSVYLSFMSKLLNHDFCVCQPHNLQNGRLFKDVPMKSTSPNPPHKLFLLIHFIEGLLPNVGIDEDSVTASGFFHLTPKRLAWENTPKLPQKCLAILRKRDPSAKGEVW